jgi:DNA-binding NarL/FixJ family response regulator
VQRRVKPSPRHILKTADPEEIMRAVRDVYQGKSVLDASSPGA